MKNGKPDFGLFGEIGRELERSGNPLWAEKVKAEWEQEARATMREISLGSEGMKYLRDCMAEGQSLSRFLLQRRDLDRGQIVTCLPASVTQEEAQRDISDGVLPQPPAECHTHLTAGDGRKFTLVPKPSMAFWLVDEIRGFLLSGKKRCCILEDMSADPKSPHLLSRPTRKLVLESEVYHILLAGDVEQHVIETTIRTAQSCVLVGAMTLLPGTLDRPDRKIALGQFAEVTERDLEAMAENAAEILVAAYDGEGYLVWKCQDI